MLMLRASFYKSHLCNTASQKIHIGMCGRHDNSLIGLIKRSCCDDAPSHIKKSYQREECFDQSFGAALWLKMQR